MKIIISSVFAFFTAGMAFAQPLNNTASTGGKIKLTNGQQIQIENTTTIEASLAMGMELTSNTSSVNSLQVKNSTDKNYTISNTLTKLKVNMNMMGQPNNYDSENKEGNNADIAKIFDERLNKTSEYEIDNRTGMVSGEKKKTNKQDTEASSPADDLMKMFGDNTEDAIVSGAFEIIPQGKLPGDSWSDTTASKDLKTIRKYTLNAVSGNEATIQLDITATAVNKLNFQEMEFEIKSETKTKAEIIADISSGLTKKRTTSSEINGSIQMMGQDMPISAKTTATSIYK